ncbi:MAG: dihydroorotate dehydrogenase electron transfer subunit [Candidatus Thermoplasmatota archaeon]|nr:dihydroorotate dehydrogenase electron transfer subunit [Candidatus Thermoplasmatota archaeon]
MKSSIRMLKVSEHIDETPNVRTIVLDGSIEAEPGQFVMVWVPGADEFPMSISYIGDQMGITYQIVGDGTKALSIKHVGDLVGIRGPYGKGYTPIGRKPLVVAGGTGMAALSPLIERLKLNQSEVRVVIGARTAREILFRDRAMKAGAEVVITTDDGSEGEKGFATDIAVPILQTREHDIVYCCGPERMMTKLADKCSELSIPMQASVERLMKCGIGICDSCAIDGLHVCRDGPVFSIDVLKGFSEFGRTKLDATGRRIDI